MSTFCVAVLNALMRSTRFCNGDEGQFTTSYSGQTRSIHHRTDSPWRTCCAIVCRSVSLLVEAWLHLLRRADRADRDHADGTSRKEKMDQPIEFPARAQLLHAATRPRSAATRDLHWLALAQNLGRHRRRIILRDPVHLCPLGAELHLCRVWQYPVDCGDFLRIEAGRHGDCRGRGHTYRAERAQKRSHVDARGSRLCRDFLFPCAVSDYHLERRHDWVDRRPILEREVW